MTARSGVAAPILSRSRRHNRTSSAWFLRASLEAVKRRLAGDTARAATTGEVQDLRREARALKECVADLTFENRLLKKA